MNQTFARCHRLTKTDEFSSVFGFRKAIRGQWLMLHYQPRPPGANGARLGLVVGKKLLRRAVDRNRVKRRLREQFRCRRTTLPACDLIVRLVSRPDPVAGYLLAADFQRLLDKLPSRLSDRQEGR